MKNQSHQAQTHRYRWPLGLCLGGIAAVVLGAQGVLGYCKATFISASPYCASEIETVFVVMVLAGLAIAPISLIVLLWRLLRAPRRKS